MSVTPTVAWSMLGISIFAFALGALFIFLYLKFKRNKKNKKETFTTGSSKIRFFEFWQHYAFIIVIFSAFLAGIILFSISITTLIQ